MKDILLIHLIVFSCWLSAADAPPRLQSSEGVPLQSVPDSVAKLLRNQVGIEVVTSQRVEMGKNADLASFDTWVQVPWPDVRKLERYHFQPSDKIMKDEQRGFEQRSPFNAWKLPNGKLLCDDFRVCEVPKDFAITPVRYQDELVEAAEFARDALAATTTADYLRYAKKPYRALAPLHFPDSTQVVWPWQAFYHAYNAACLGHEELVPDLMRYAVGKNYEFRQNVLDHLERERMETSMRKFEAGGSRTDLLAEMEETHQLCPGGACDWEVVSFIEPLRRELKDDPPAYAKKAPAERTEEEKIRTLIWELRELHEFQLSVPGYPDVFGKLNETINKAGPNTARRVIALGRPAIPYLIEVLEDYTPTRTMGCRWHVRLLRRMDVAMHCIGELANVDFYLEASTSGDLHNDTPERRNVAIARVKAWWAESQKKAAPDKRYELKF